MNFEVESNVLQQSTSKRFLNVEKTSDGQFKCPIDGCDHVLDSEETIENHFKEHESSLELETNNQLDNFMSISFKRDEQFVYVHKRVDEVDKSSSDNFVCPFDGCDKAYPTKRNLTRHIVVGHSGRKVVCIHNGCDKTFPTEQQMQRHYIRIHKGGGKKLQCDWPGCQYVGHQSSIYSHRERHQPIPKPIVLQLRQLWPNIQQS